MTDASYSQPAPSRPVGKVRNPLVVFLLMIITLGIYGLVYYYKTYQEMKDHSGQGVGGVVGLLLAIFIGIVTPFLLASEVGNLYASEGLDKPVSGLTGFWVLIPILGALIWLFKVQGALNRFWESHGATA
ncbi:MAG: conserved rane protein of unknown function [Actinomycetia bacterium]|nr:conserved rane protein of unknown function [Actinomycetes bacterium]